LSVSNAWEEPTVLRLIERSGQKDPVALIEAYAHRCLREANGHSLPVDVLGIASLLGIRVRVAEQPFAGRVYVDERGMVIIDLNARDSEARRRFTCAHEIMHTAFPGFRRDARYRLDRSVGSSERSRGEEDYLCDRGAAALLMPVHSVEGLYDAGRGLGDVERLAAAARVSLEAAAIRLVSLSTQPTVFVLLEMGHQAADNTRLGRGDEKEKLRIRYGFGAGLGLRVPRHGLAAPESIYLRALNSRGAIRGVDTIPGVPSRHRFLIEAKAYGREEPPESRRVLALARSIGTSDNGARPEKSVRGGRI
jgi:hypothetical protein